MSPAGFAKTASGNGGTNERRSAQPVSLQDKANSGFPADVERFSFSEESAPWIVDPIHCTWRCGIDELRARSRAMVPELVRPRRLPPSARMLAAGTHLGKAVGAWALIEKRSGGSVSRGGLAKRLRVAFQELGPTYIKLGQILSSGEGIFPEEVVEQFRLLRDRVEPESFETVRATVEEDLGRPIEAIFSRFESEPLAAASIAQVHKARLCTGETVVVKVQRPQVRDLVTKDLAIMAWLAPLVLRFVKVSWLANPPALVELFAETIVEELDFRLEAQNMLDIAEVLAKHHEPGTRPIIVPRPHPKLVTRRILVMEELGGFPWGEAQAMRNAGIDTAEVLHASVVAFLEGVMLYGVFHGDLHGGNLFVRSDGKVVMLDFGITGRLDERKRVAYVQLLMGALINDPIAQVRAARDIGALPQNVDVHEVVKALGLDKPPIDPASMSPNELMAELKSLMRSLLHYGARMPKELVLMVKDMFFLDGAVATMAPDVDILERLVSIATYFTTHHGDRIAAESGIDLRETQVDLTAIRATLGAKEGTPLTYRTIQERREEILQRFEEKEGKGKGSEPKSKIQET